MKKIFLMVSVVLLAVALASCGGAPAPVAVAVGATTPDAEIAKALTDSYFGSVVIDDFSYGDKIANLDQVSVARIAVNGCLSDPSFVALAAKGYKVYAVGHACKFGSKGANNSMGISRARQVVNELRGLKIGTKYVGVKTVGDKVMVKDVNGGDPTQRRVTFEVAKK